VSNENVERLKNKFTEMAKNDKKRRFHSLRDKIYRMDVLECAWKEVKKNKGVSGPDGQSITEIEEQGAEKLLSELFEELRTGTYKPGPVLRVYIPKKNGGKRPLGIPNVRDRIVQAALKQIIEPIFEADFLPFSYGFRPGRSAKDANSEIHYWLKRGHRHVLDADIEKCFDEIPHDKLMNTIARRISDKYVLKLIKMWLKSPVLADGTLQKMKKGTPQGGVISPLLANIYLHQVDTAWLDAGMTRKGGWNAQMVRYADDIVVLSNRPVTVPREKLQEILAVLGLKLSDKKTRSVKAEDGFDFLGFRFIRKYNRESRKYVCQYFPSPKSVKRMKEKIREIAGNNRTYILPNQIAKELNIAVTGWCNYFRWSWHNRAFTKVYSYVCSRFQRFLRRRKEKSGFGRYRDYPAHTLKSKYGLQTWFRSQVN